MRLSLFTLFFLGAMQLSCAHKSATKDLLTPDFLVSQGTKQLTFLGDNERPRFSADGEKLIFTSRARPHHKQAQVYELQWKKNIERRITFSDGDAFTPTYADDSTIIYASTTDEIKENPLQNKNFDRENPPSELYLSDLFGTEIERLTHQPGYEGEPAFWNWQTKDFLYFSSHRGELKGLYRLDLKTKQVIFVSVEKNKEKRSPALTPDGKNLAWIEIDNNKKTQSLMMANNMGKMPQLLKENEGTYQDLSLGPETPARLYYSIVRKGEKKSQLEVYDIDNKCTRVIFKSTDSLYSPTLSKQNKLAFTRDFQGKKQIYLADLPADLGPCLEASVPATLKE